MDHQRGAVGVEQRTGRARRRGQAGAGQRDGLAEHAVGRDGDVREVAGMRPVRVVEPVLAVRRVPVRPGACEVRRVAPPDGVDVKPVDAMT